MSVQVKAKTDVTKTTAWATCGASGRHSHRKERKISVMNGRGMRGGVLGRDVWLDRVRDA